MDNGIPDMLEGRVGCCLGVCDDDDDDGLYFLIPKRRSVICPLFPSGITKGELEKERSGTLTIGVKS